MGLISLFLCKLFLFVCVCVSEFICVALEQKKRKMEDLHSLLPPLCSILHGILPQKNQIPVEQTHINLSINQSWKKDKVSMRETGTQMWFLGVGQCSNVSDHTIVATHFSLLHAFPLRLFVFVL